MVNSNNDNDIYEILTWPNPILKKPTRKVSLNKLAELNPIIQKMIRTMEQMNGIGLAAPQVGISERFFIAVLNDQKEPQVIINPIILKRSKEQSVDEEGCLSFPGQYAQVSRPTWILVSWTDLNGNNIETKLENFAARVFLHEFDHLNGVLLINNALDGLYMYVEEKIKTNKN